MKINIQFQHATLRDELRDFVTQRVKGLSRFDENILTGDVHLLKDNSTGTENKVCEIKLVMPGGDLFTKQKAVSFEEATTRAVTALERQIEKKKNGTKSY